MGKRRSALRDVLTVGEYREMLRNAARIKDRDESISLFFFLVVMGRLGLRVGEVIHMEDSWFKPERSVVSIQPHVDCDCGLCRHYARKWANRNNLGFEEVLNRYWKVKDNSDRDVYVPTERDRNIIELYFQEVPFTSVSYSTINRRLKKVAELTSGISPSNVYPHMLRATAASHLAWAGFAPSLLDRQFGWSDEKTKERYVKKTAYKTKLEFDRILDRDNESSKSYVQEDPQTYDELRPDNDDELIEIESWSVSSSVKKHPRHRDEEPLIHDLDEFSSDKHGAAFDPVSPAICARLDREQRLIDEKPGLEIHPSTRRIAAASGGAFSVAAVSGSVAATSGLLQDIVAGNLMGTLPVTIAFGIYIPWMVWHIHETFHENPHEVDPKTLFDRVIVGTHAVVSQIKSRLGSPLF